MNNEEKLAKLEHVIEKYRNVRGALIPVLHEAQEIYGYLPMEVQKIISEKLNIPLTEIYGVVTFYTQFSLNPKGKYKIGVCLGTACYVRGSQEIIEKVQEHIGVHVGDCSEDGMFSLDATRCVGACGLAPVMTINDTVFGKVKPEEVEGILKKVAEEAQEE